MLHRTLSEAQHSARSDTVIVRATVGGRVYYRTYEFDSYRHKCRRCRNANQRGRLHSTGHVCEQCGNPYAGFVRQSRTKRSGKWETLRHVYGSSGKLH